MLRKDAGESIGGKEAEERGRRTWDNFKENVNVFRKRVNSFKERGECVSS